MRTTSFFMIRIRSNRPRRLVAVSGVTLGAVLIVVSCSEAPKVPGQLESLAHYSESLYDAARTNDWTAAAAQLDTLKRGATDLSATVNGSAELKSSVSSHLAVIDTSVSNRNRAATLRSANEVTRLAPEVTRPLNPQLPAQRTLPHCPRLGVDLGPEPRDLTKPAAGA